jgi:hypothetical protein
MPRVRHPAILVAAVAAAIVGAYVWQMIDVSHAQLATSDFTSIYVGGTLFRQGHGAVIYDQSLQAAVHDQLIAPLQRGTLPFVNPPVAAMVTAPLTLLPLAAAYHAWQAAQLLMLTAGLGLAAWAAPWPASMRRTAVSVAAAAAGLAGVGTLALGVLGQWDGLSALGVGAGYWAWRRDARWTAGAVLAGCTLLAKPHLVVGLAALLVGWRDRRLLGGAACAALALALLSILAVGPAGISGFAAALTDDAGRWPLPSMLGFTGITGSWIGGGALAEALAGCASVAALVACAWLGRRVARDPDTCEPVLAGAVALSLLASPHLLSQDLVLLAPALVAMAAWAAARAASRGADRDGAGLGMVVGAWAVLCAAAALDLGAQGPAPPGRLVPWALIAVAGAGSWLSGRPSPRPASPVAAAVDQGRGSGRGVSPEYS